MQTDKGAFDKLLSQMIGTPPKKEAEIRVRKKKAQTEQPKPSRQQSDRQSEAVPRDTGGAPSV